jgi:hypothetical protein
MPIPNPAHSIRHLLTVTCDLQIKCTKEKPSCKRCQNLKQSCVYTISKAGKVLGAIRVAQKQLGSSSNSHNSSRNSHRHSIVRPRGAVSTSPTSQERVRMPRGWHMPSRNPIVDTREQITTPTAIENSTAKPLPTGKCYGTFPTP